MLQWVWQALNYLSIHATYCVIVAVVSPGETKMWAAVCENDDFFTFVDHVKTNKHMFEFFSPSGSHTILVYRSNTNTKHRAASLWQQSFLFAASQYSSAVRFVCRVSLLSRRLRQRKRLNASMLSICSSVCLFVCLSFCLSPKCKKTRFSQKLSNLELWSLLMTYRKSYMGFSKNLLLDP